MGTSRVLAGREVELAALAGFLARRTGGCFVVVGEAGIGKSALVQASAADLEGPVMVGSATASPGVALRPLVEVALEAVRRGADPAAAGLRVHRRALAALLPGMVEHTDRDDAIHPLVLADALSRLLDAVPRATRTDVLIEDLHWADVDTLGAVEALVDRAPARGTRLVLTLRPEGPAWPVVQRLAERRVAALLELGPLGPDDVRTLVAHRLDVDPGAVPSGLVAAVAAAEGRPLWVEEITQTARVEGHLRRDDDGWEFTAVGQILPRTLTAAVARRLSELGDEVRELLEAAALLGTEFPTEVLADAFGGPQPVATCVRHGVEAGLLTVTGVGGVRFRHDLLREAVLHGTLTAQAQVAAARMLDVLDTSDDQWCALGAGLARRAGDPARATELLVRTARRDLGRGLPAAAATALEQALGFAGRGARAELRELRVHALAVAGDVDAALAEAVVADAELTDLPGSQERRWRLGLAVIRATGGQGRWADAERLVATLRMRFPDVAAAAALSALVALERGRYDDAEQEARAALAASDPDTGDLAAQCEAATVLGRLARRSDLVVAQRWFQHAEAVATQGDLAVWRAHALHELATIAQLRDLDIGPLTAARDAAIEASAPGLVAMVNQHLAAVCGVRFEPDAALATARDTLDAARRLGARGQQAFAWILIGQAHAATGDTERSGVAAEEALALAGSNPEITGLAWATCRGLPALLADDLDAAARHWSRGIAALRELPGVTPLPPWYLWGLLATALDVEGDGGDRARGETASPELRVATGADALWHLAQAVAHGRAGRAGQATDESAQADALFNRVPAFAGYRHLGHRLAAPAAITDGWGAPGAWMIATDRWATDRGFTGLARAARSLSRRAGVPQRRAGRGDTPAPAHLSAVGVTTREMDVLALIGSGLTNKQIAVRLYITPRTVKGHVEALLAKTGAVNRTQLALHLNPATPRA